MSAVKDYCAGCGLQLKPHPVAGRYYCCADAYWSEETPLISDQSIHSRMTGQPFRWSTQPNSHLLLSFYRPALGWV